MNHHRLSARHVSRAFGPLKAVDDVSLSIEAGQVVALLGQSGSGKSTLLRMLAGLEGLDSGEVFASGTLVANAHQSTPPEKRGLGMVFQDYALFPHLNALQNVAFGLSLQTKSDRLDIATTWLKKVGLAARANYFPHQLSGGEQQRVALARALAPSPQAVLMDEPFSGLDPHLRIDLQRTMLAALREAGVAALIVTHDTEEALGLADVVAIMDQGRLIQSGSPSEVYTRPASFAAARALGPVWTHSARAQNGVVQTTFGNFETVLDGDVIVAGRPEATKVVADQSGQFQITDRRGVGRFTTLTLTNEQGIVYAQVEAGLTLPTEGRARVCLDPTDAMIFKS